VSSDAIRFSARGPPGAVSAPGHANWPAENPAGQPPRHASHRTAIALTFTLSRLHDSSHFEPRSPVALPCADADNRNPLDDRFLAFLSLPTCYPRALHPWSKAPPACSCPRYRTHHRHHHHTRAAIDLLRYPVTTLRAYLALVFVLLPRCSIVSAPLPACALLFALAISYASGTGRASRRFLT
jgi:hypothetical protein